MDWRIKVCGTKQKKNAPDPKNTTLDQEKPLKKNEDDENWKKKEHNKTKE